MKVRRKGKTLSWSKDILISKDKVPSSQMIYIPYVHESYIHVWCHVYEQIIKGASRLLVMFCPLYVLRSHLPCSLFVSMAMPNLGKKKEVEMAGKGRSLQLELLGDAKYDLSFKLRSDTDKVDPALTLTPELISQVERKETKKCDFDKMLAMMNDQWSDKWPYTGYSISDESQSQKQPASELSDLDLSLPSIDLSLTLTEYWPGCSTVLIDVCPWCLLTNHSTLDLVFIDSSKVTWPLPQGKTFSPPKLQSSFNIGIVINGNLHQGGEIGLSEEAVADQRYRQDLGKTLYIDGYAQTQILVTSHQNMHVYFLTLQSKMVNGMRIVNIRETYCISNQTSIDLLLSHHSLQPCPQKVGTTSIDLLLSHHSLQPCPQKKVGTPSIDLSLSHHSLQPCPQKFSVKCSDDNMRCLQSKSTETTPLPSWAGYTMEDTSNIDISFVNYVMIKPQTTNQNTASAERSSTYDDWSFPVRLVANENPGRVTVSTPVQTETVMSLPLCIVGQTRNGVSYFIVKEDNSPSCLLYNFTTVPIVYGYQNISISRAGYTTQEEAELTDILPTIPPNQHVFYTPSSTNRQFLLSIGDSGLPKIHVGVQQTLETDESNTESKHSSDQDSGVSWSDPLDVNEEMERFISIPNNMNLKIKVIKVSMVTHVVINAANKAEVSAKEIRNKIGKVTTMESHPSSEDVNIREYDVCVPKQDVFIHSNSITRNLELYISLHFHHLCLILQDETSSNNEITEVIRVSCDHLFLAHYPLIEGFDEDSPSHDCYSISAENLQVDNQLYTTKGLYDFPVIFARQELKSKDKDFLVEFHSMNLSEKLAVIKSRSFAHIQVVMETDCLSHSLIKSVEIALEPVIGNVDDRFVYRMLEEVEKLLPTSLKDNKKGLKEITRLPQALKVMSHGLSSPIRIEHLVIHPCSLLISVHASLKVFIASDKTPLSFGKFDKKNVNSTAHQLTRVLAMHYASGALFRAGIVVGSLEILGNPTGLVRSIGSGVADLVRLPYGGLTQGPGAFVSGVSSGMSSFVRNISSGMLTSVTNFASSVSRNMERLSMDDTHRERQEERRRQHPEGLTSGLKNGLTGFGMSLLGAVAGLADQPLQNLMSRHESEGQRSAATELVSGVGKGLVGVFTKPIGGAAEFFSQTGQGLLYGTGLSGNIIKPCYPSDDMVVSDMFNSRLKYVRKLLQCLPKCQLQSSLLANYLDVMDTEVKVELLLTNELMIMISIDDDSQQQAFSLVELEVKVEPDNPQLITFVWRDSFHQDMPQVSVGKVKTEKENKDRVAAFIDGTSEFVRPDISLKLNLNPANEISDFPQVSPSESVESGEDSRPISPSLSNTCRPSLAPEYHFLVDPYSKDVFIAIFNATKLKLSGKGFIFIKSEAQEEGSAMKECAVIINSIKSETQEEGSERKECAVIINSIKSETQEEGSARKECAVIINSIKSEAQEEGSERKECAVIINSIKSEAQEEGSERKECAVIINSIKSEAQEEGSARKECAVIINSIKSEAQEEGSERKKCAVIINSIKSGTQEEGSERKKCAVIINSIKSEAQEEGSARKECAVIINSIKSEAQEEGSARKECAVIINSIKSEAQEEGSARFQLDQSKF
ncbi:VPS13B [Mytilus coruscus]|uniref:VPS13B n=1 Tax=Mytilus coruscus TaxID=42192 RepID=A0A6J8AP78_MYTCO|nr:VPS13B [Mytilus coruscus]